MSLPGILNPHPCSLGYSWYTCWNFRLVWDNYGLLQIEMEFIINSILFTLKLLFTFIDAFWPVLCVCWIMKLLTYFKNTSMRRIWVHNDIHITCTKIVKIFHNFIINRAVKSEKELYVQCKKKINTQYPHAVITCLLFYWPCVTMWGIFFRLKKPQASLNNA